MPVETLLTVILEVTVFLKDYRSMQLSYTYQLLDFKRF